MSLDSVSKIEVLCHSVRRADLVAALESFGGVHLLNLARVEDGNLEYFRPTHLDTAELSRKIANLENAIGFLEEEAAGETEIPAPGEEVEESELLALLDDSELVAEAKRAWMTAVRMARLEGIEKELLQEKAFLSDWRGMPVSIDELRRGDAYLICAGVIPAEFLETARRIADEVPLFHLEELGRGKRTARILVAMHVEVEEKVFPELTAAGFSIQDFGARKGRIADLLAEQEEKLRQIAARRRALHERAVLLAKRLGDFRKLRDAASLLLERIKATNASLSSGSALLFRAWIRTRDLDSLERMLSGLGEVDVEVIEPDEGEVPPSPLTEKPVAEPYMILTDMYGRPTRKDPDPTPLMAPFYALFFGICIGDAGYGLAIALGSALGWFMVARRHGDTKLFRLLFQGGIASIIVGVFLGGWFGIEYHRLPRLLQAPADLLNGLVPGFRPGEPGQESFSVSKQFLYLTLALGLVQLSTGIVVNLVKRLRAGEGPAAVVDQSGWLLATAGLFPWLFNRYLLDGTLYDVNGPMDKVFMNMLTVGAVLIFIMGGRKARGFGKIGLGAYATYGIVNLLGDVLSYSRLFALALSSAIIAQVINRIAGMLMNQVGIPVLGFVLAMLVVVGGHAFNVAMAALSGFIHTARLQFVEFFGKFYDGTGIPFKPLVFKPKYVYISRKDPTALGKSEGRR